MTPNHLVPATGKLYIIFPLWNGSLGIGGSDPELHYIDSTVTCNGVTGDVTLNSSATCSYD